MEHERCIQTFIDARIITEEQANKYSVPQLLYAVALIESLLEEEGVSDTFGREDIRYTGEEFTYLVGELAANRLTPDSLVTKLRTREFDGERVVRGKEFADTLLKYGVITQENYDKYIEKFSSEPANIYDISYETTEQTTTLLGLEYVDDEEYNSELYDKLYGQSDNDWNIEYDFESPFAVLLSMAMVLDEVRNLNTINSYLRILEERDLDTFIEYLETEVGRTLSDENIDAALSSMPKLPLMYVE